MRATLENGGAKYQLEGDSVMLVATAALPKDTSSGIETEQNTFDAQGKTYLAESKSHLSQQFKKDKYKIVCQVQDVPSSATVIQNIASKVRNQKAGIEWPKDGELAGIHTLTPAMRIPFLHMIKRSTLALIFTSESQRQLLQWIHLNSHLIEMGYTLQCLNEHSRFFSPSYSITIPLEQPHFEHLAGICFNTIRYMVPEDFNCTSQVCCFCSQT